MCGMRTLVAVWAVWAASSVACQHPPPPIPPAVEQPVRAFGDVAGRWVASDDLDWFYALSLRADGDLELAIDRGKLGRCVTHATLVQAAAAPSFELSVVVDECHRDRAAGPLHAVFPSFTGKTLTLELTDAGMTSRHTFSRAPESMK